MLAQGADAEVALQVRGLSARMAALTGTVMSGLDDQALTAAIGA